MHEYNDDTNFGYDLHLLVGFSGVVETEGPIFGSVISYVFFSFVEPYNRAAAIYAYGIFLAAFIYHLLS
jgi:hypothetical protein